MPIFLIKSLLGLGLLLLSFVALFTMFEIYGRTEKRFNVSTLITLHRVNGFLYLLLFLVISYICLRFMAETKADFSPRSALHSVFAVVVFVLLCFKIAVVHVYRGFYGKLQHVGPWVALLTFLLLGTSAGYFFLVTNLGREKAVARLMEEKRPEAKPAPAGAHRIVARTDAETVSRGKALFEAKCNDCHYRDSTKKLVGPGLKGVLKNPTLPASKADATPEAILNQLRNPYMLMPSFAYLTDDEAQAVLAFVNTL